MNYATLNQARRYPGFMSSETADDDLLTFFLDKSSEYINERYGFRFEPVRETRTFDTPASPRVLFVGPHLLEIESITNGDGSAVASSSYVLKPSNAYPKFSIELKTSSSVFWKWGASGSSQDTLSVTGVWGFHKRYSRAWVNSLDTVTNAGGINDSALSFTVSDSDGAASDLDNPRFQVGQLIRMDSEYRLVLSVNNTSNTIAATRGENGTVAASHSQGTAISIFRPMSNIVMATIRLTIWRYRQKDVNSFDKTTILGTGIATIPSAIPPDVAALLPVIGGLSMG